MQIETIFIFIDPDILNSESKNCENICTQQQLRK